MLRPHINGGLETISRDLRARKFLRSMNTNANLRFVRRRGGEEGGRSWRALLLETICPWSPRSLLIARVNAGPGNKRANDSKLAPTSTNKRPIGQTAIHRDQQPTVPQNVMKTPKIENAPSSGLQYLSLRTLTVGAISFVVTPDVVWVEIVDVYSLSKYVLTLLPVYKS